MPFKNIFAVFAAVAAFGFADLAIAQDGGATLPENNGQQPIGQTTDSEQARPGGNTVRGSGRRLQNERQVERRPAAPDTGAALAAAQAAATGAGLTDCQVAEAVLRGESAMKEATYEIVCADGPGYLVVASTPPTPYNCLELAHSASRQTEVDPLAQVTSGCQLEVNKDSLRGFSYYARQAGLTCTVDQGAIVGRGVESAATIYEIGCANAAGYWIEKPPAGEWMITGCHDVVLRDKRTCNFTTPEETSAWWAAAITGAEFASCEPATNRRRLGKDGEERSIYFVTCADSRNLIVRIAPGQSVAAIVQDCAREPTLQKVCSDAVAAAAAPPPPPAGGRA